MKKIIVLCVTLVLSVGGYFLYSSLTRIKTIPNHLIGSWVTDAPGYEDRYMDFEEKQMTIGTGAESLQLNFIDEVKATSDGGNIEYRIRYTNIEQLSFTLAIVYSTGGGGSFTIRHLEKIVWKRMRAANAEQK